jgi:ABC-type proline/glycine betaine transport system ATPase subunit
MKKKINEGLKESLIENGLIEPNAMQDLTFDSKSGADCIIIAPSGGKSTTIVINVIQQLVKKESNLLEH